MWTLYNILVHVTVVNLKGNWSFYMLLWSCILIQQEMNINEMLMIYFIQRITKH